MSDTFTSETYNTLCNDAEGYLTNESPEQARELLQKAISLIGTRPRARSLLADTCMSMELWSEARSQLEILITLDEGNTTNNFRLAQVLEELGEYQLAKDNYSVVLDDEPDHHGANVAVKRIETRAKESGVNLADIFNAPLSDGSLEKDTDDGGENFKDGLQVFPDVPSDELFANSGADEEDSVERLLRNIGLSGDSTEVEEDDASELLENIGVSTSQTLQSAFSDSEDSPEEGSSEPPGEFDDTDETEKKHVSRSLDEIFGTPSSTEKEETEAETETEEPAEKDEAEPFHFSSDKTLEAIFNAPEGEEPEVEVAEPEAEEPEVEVTEPEAEEPEVEVAEPEAEEPEVEVAEPEVEEPEVEVAEPEAEEPEVEVAEPEAEEPEVEEAEEGKEKLKVVFKQESDLSIDPWAPESGLLTVHLKSGTALVKQSMLSVYQNSIKAEFSDDDTLELSGEGTFLLNCGCEEPLIVELTENMVIRKDAVIFHTGTFTAELLDIRENDSLYVVKEEIREKVIFKADHPMRVILLGGNSHVFYVRTSSIMAADPEILLSHVGSLKNFTEITGFGKVYLIE